MPYESLDRQRLTQALARLSELAIAEGVELELSLYDGAVFTLVYGSRDGTKDVDALIRPADIGERLARKVALEQGPPKTGSTPMSPSSSPSTNQNVPCRPMKRSAPVSGLPSRPPPTYSR